MWNVLGLRWVGRLGEEETVTALIAGVVSIAVIWVVVIYGSIYMNKNVQ